jgi:hypothetical protein
MRVHGVAALGVVLACACQPQARRLLVLDLALAEPALLSGTARPWHDAGYTVEYRRFYPHLARSDFDRYRVVVFLLGREPEAPSDALTAADLALLSEWVVRGGVVVLGYDADGEGYLDRWTANRWLAYQGTGIVIGDRVLEDTTARAVTTSGRPQPWAEARTVGHEPLGAVYDPFPLDRNDVITTRERDALLAVTSRNAFVRAPRVPSARASAGVAAAGRVGEGLVVVISRHALGALGSQFRPTTTPLGQVDALERTAAFLRALARWTRRPAEWAHVPPARRGTPLTLQQAPSPVELGPAPRAPPEGADTTALPLVPDPKFDRATSVPEWLRQQGVRLLWASLLPWRDGHHVVRTNASLDSLVTLLDVGGFNLLGGDADPEETDSVHVHWEERAAVRRVWAAAVGRLEPTSVAWIPVLDYDHARRAAPDSSRGARGEGLAAPCALDSTLWTDGLGTPYAALGRLAAEQRTLVIALGWDVAGARGYSMGQEFCDAAWRRGTAGMAGEAAAALDSLPYAARYRTLREAGLLPRYYRALEREVSERAAALRDRILHQRQDLYFAFRLPALPGDWFTLGLLRGFSLPDRPLLVLTPELPPRRLTTVYRSAGLNLAHAVSLPPAALSGRDWTGLRHLVFDENDGFWLAAEDATSRANRVPLDSLGRVLRRLAR